MKLSNYIIDLGRVVAYYPNLKKVTESTTATILLCQLLYWTPKAKDRNGWIYKNADEIEEETGLTYNEQKTARKILVEKKLVEEEFKRLDHTNCYRVNQEELNTQWEKVTGEKVEPIVEEKKTFPAGSIEAEFMTPQVPQIVQAEPMKKGDLVDGFVAALNSSGMKKMNALIVIKDKIEKRLHIVADDKRWQSFIEFVYVKQEKEGKSIDKFIDWALKSGFDPLYWSPEKMRTIYPQAFMVADVNKPREDFVQKLPERKEEVFAPMPKDIGRERHLT